MTEIHKTYEIRKKDLLYPELSYKIVGCSYEVFKGIGFGHREIVYQRAMAEVFRERNITFKEQVSYPLQFRKKIICRNYLDFVVEGKVIVELKKNFHFSKAHIDQVVGYLKYSGLSLAILINFGPQGVTFKRFVNIMS